MYASMYVCMHACMQVCICACMQVCTYVCMHASMYVFIYFHASYRIVVYFCNNLLFVFQVKVLGNTTIVEKDLEDWIIKTVRNDNPDNTLRYYEFKNLKSNSDYVTEIEAENDLGKGAVSKFFFRTAYGESTSQSLIRSLGETEHMYRGHCWW